MIPRSLLLALVVLSLSCVSAGPPTRPNDREWNVLLAEAQRIDASRNAAARPRPDAPRKEQIEALLEMHDRFDPVVNPFLASVQEYYERTGDPRAAVLLANEKVRLGNEYLEILSRYDRAIAIYRDALLLDPSNEVAKQSLALAESRRFVGMDRFSSVRAGMKEEEVRRIVGMPREDWIKHVVQNSRMYSVWIYPKADGGASAIYFENGVVYHTNWNAAPAAEKGSADSQSE